MKCTRDISIKAGKVFHAQIQINRDAMRAQTRSLDTAREFFNIPFPRYPFQGPLLVCLKNNLLSRGIYI